ncbi:MAG: glycosyltransferase [Pseudomonadota bacterium]
MSKTSRPTVSVVVPVYRHQPYLVSALKSILAFDYSPLEIIIQDDASPDDAFEVIEHVVAAYDGPHKVIIGKNEKNLSMANFNVLMEKAGGDYIIAAHDDDIQYRERVSMIMDAFLTHKVSMVSSNAIMMTASGDRIRPDSDFTDCRIDALQFSRTGWTDHVHGPALAWHRDVFDKFGPIDVEGTSRASDFVIPYRAALLNGIYYLSQTTFDRRLHANSRGSIGRNTDDEDAYTVEESSEAITQYIYMLKTTDFALQKSLITRKQHQAMSENIRDMMVTKAGQLAVSRNRLHMKKRRMTWISHGAGAVTRADLPNADISEKALVLFATSVPHENLPSALRSREDIMHVIRARPWQQVAYRHPFKIRHWMAVWRLQRAFRQFGKSEVPSD